MIFLQTWAEIDARNLPKNFLIPKGDRGDSKRGTSRGASFLKICILGIFGDISSNLSWDRFQKHPKNFFDPQGGQGGQGGHTVVPNCENPPNIMKFLTCYIIDSYWNSDLADSENGIFELFCSPNSAQKRSDFHLSALKILIFHFLYSIISMEGFKKVVFPNQRAPKSRIWVVQIKPYSILVAPETLHFWASANILRLLIELVFNFWQKLGIHFEFWTCWFDRIFLTFYFSSNRNV